MTDYQELEMLNSIRLSMIRVPESYQNRYHTEYYNQLVARISELVTSEQLYPGFYGMGCEHR